MAVIPSISAVVIVALGEVTDLGLEIGPEVVTDPGLEVEIGPVVDRDLVLGQGKDLVQEVGAVTDQVPEQDPARDRNRVQVQDQARDKDRVRWIDRGHHLVQDRVRADKVPLVANGIVECLHPETVNAVRGAVAASHVQDRLGVQ